MKIYLINLIIAAVGAERIVRFIDFIPYNAFTVITTLIVLYFTLWLLSFFYHKEHFRKVPRILNLSLYTLKELVMASLKVAYDVLTIKHHMTPGIIAYDLEAKTDLEVMVLANLISLTPGTLSIEVSEDKTILYVHALYINNGDLEELKDSIRLGFEKKLLAITR